MGPARVRVAGSSITVVIVWPTKSGTNDDGGGNWAEGKVSEEEDEEEEEEREKEKAEEEE